VIAELIRFRSDQIGTFGALVMPGRGVVVTVERAWVPIDKHGATWPFGIDRESCIPAGTYRLERDHSPKFGRLMWYIVGRGVVLQESSDNPVQWRSGCMFHAANQPHELMGCIAPGTIYEPRGNQVLKSSIALNQLTSWLDTIAEPQLHIRNAF